MLWMVPYIAAGGIMWFVAHQLAPFGYTIGLFRSAVAAVLMGVTGSVAESLVQPYIGSWSILAGIVVSALPVMLVLRLSFWRSVVAVVIYWVVVIGATIIITLGSKPPAQGTTPAKSQAAL